MIGYSRHSSAKMRIAQMHLGNGFDDFFSASTHCFGFKEASLTHKLAENQTQGLANDIKNSNSA